MNMTFKALRQVRRLSKLLDIAYHGVIDIEVILVRMF